jgi:hypothetical protein
VQTPVAAIVDAGPWNRTFWACGISEFRIDRRNGKFLMTPIMLDDGSEGPVIDATEMWERFVRNWIGLLTLLTRRHALSNQSKPILLQTKVLTVWGCAGGRGR